MARKKTIKIRVTSAELGVLKRSAAAKDLSVSAFLRRAGLSPEIPGYPDTLLSELIALRRTLIQSGPAFLNTATNPETASAARKSYDAAVQNLGHLLRRVR